MLPARVRRRRSRRPRTLSSMTWSPTRATTPPMMAGSTRERIVTLSRLAAADSAARRCGHEPLHLRVERHGGGDLGGDDAALLVDQLAQRLGDAWHLVESVAIGQDVQEVADQRRRVRQQTVERGALLRRRHRRADERSCARWASAACARSRRASSASASKSPAPLATLNAAVAYRLALALAGTVSAGEVAAAPSPAARSWPGTAARVRAGRWRPARRA